MSVKEQSPLSPDYPEFKSALPYCLVRDFGYPEFHPLHYGIPLSAMSGTQRSSEIQGDYDDNQLEDGPPWQEDPDLTSPVVTSHEHGDRISKEYEFSVASADEIHGRAVALFDFTPENDNEAPLREGQIIWVSYRHGQGWLVAEDPETGETGLVPEEYVQILGMVSDNNQDGTVGQVCLSPEADSDGWVDEIYEQQEAYESDDQHVPDRKPETLQDDNTNTNDDNNNNNNNSEQEKNSNEDTIKTSEETDDDALQTASLPTTEVVLDKFKELNVNIK